MASRTYPGTVVAVLAVIACSGWIVAWNSARAPKVATVAQGATGDTRSGKARETRSPSPASFVHDSVTARLLAGFEAINAAAVPGEANKKLILACRGALMDGNIQRRERNYSLLLQLMRPEDGPALHELFLQLHQEGRAYGDYKGFAVRWGELDAVGALKYLTSQVPASLPREDFRSIIRGWAQTDPAAAMEWMNENADLAANLGGRSAMIEGWIREDPTSAVKWLNQNKDALSPQEYVENVRIAMSEQLNGSTTGLTEAGTWLASLPDDGLSNGAAANAWNAAQWSLGELNYDKAAAVWGEVGNEPWMSFQQFQHFSATASRSRAADKGVEGFLAALDKTWPAEKVTSQFDRWASENPEATMAWLESAPPSAVTRAATKGLIKALEKTDPTAAAKWAAKTND